MEQATTLFGLQAELFFGLIVGIGFVYSVAVAVYLLVKGKSK